MTLFLRRLAADAQTATEDERLAAFFGEVFQYHGVFAQSSPMRGVIVPAQTAAILDVLTSARGLQATRLRQPMNRK
jgi:hypothetical protein